MKLLEENIEVNFETLDQAIFFRSEAKNISNKRKKTNKLDFSKSKKFFATNDTIKKMKRQPTEWETIFANYISNMGPVFQIYRELIT